MTRADSGGVSHTPTGAVQKGGFLYWQAPGTEARTARVSKSLSKEFRKFGQEQMFGLN